MARTTSTSEAYLSVIECQLYPEGSPLNYDLVNSTQSSERAKAKNCEASYFTKYYLQSIFLLMILLNFIRLVI